MNSSMKGSTMSKTNPSEKATEVKWLLNIEDHDYPAAEAYLLIIYEPEKVNKLSKKLKKAPIVEFKAKDIFRASQLSLLGISNSHVEKDRKKILAGKALSPLLLVRDDRNSKVIIADGYHRLCAIYGFNEDAQIHCKIV
jgi:disulfide oxidoreductase YuzD